MKSFFAIVFNFIIFPLIVLGYKEEILENLMIPTEEDNYYMENKGISKLIEPKEINQDLDMDMLTVSDKYPFKTKIPMQEILEICGTSSSLNCGVKVIRSLSAKNDERIENDSIYKRCKARKEFMRCIDGERRKCLILAKEELYPLLPPKSVVSSFQEKIWKSLWTSGGCVLEI